MTIVVELLEPALVQSVDDLLSLDPAQVKQVSLRLNPLDGDAQGVETRVEPETTSLLELVRFARAAQNEPTTVELWYRGRFEAFTL